MILRLAHAWHSTRISKAVCDGAVSLVFLHAGVNTVKLEGLFEGVDSVGDLVLCLLELRLGDDIVLLSLSKFEFQLLCLAVTLALLVLLPVFDTLLVPLLHEAGIALQFIDLDAAHFLLAHSLNLGLFGGAAGCEAILAILLFFKLIQVRLHVELLLRLVEGVDACLEELVLHFVVLLLGVGDFLGGLIVAELAGLSEHGDVRDWVHLLQAHLQLIEEAESNSSLPLHDLVNHLGVELDVQIAQGRLQLLKVLQTVRDGVPNFKSCNDCPRNESGRALTFSKSHRSRLAS